MKMFTTKIQDFFNIKKIVFLSFFFTYLSFSQNDITKYDFPIEQTEIIDCNPDSIEMLYVKNTHTFLDEVKKCNNIRVLILKETDISYIPTYFKFFKKLEKIILDDIKIVPNNIHYIPNLTELSIIRVNNIKFPDKFFDSLSLKLVKINNCKNLDINNIKSDELQFYHLDVAWNKNVKFQFTSKKISLVDVNFTLMDRCLKNVLLEEINIYSCINIQITNSFFIKFPQLKKIEIEL